MSDKHTITVQDTRSRHWTIVTEPTVVGFRWRVYCHPGDVGVASLELWHPGGVAHGWTDDDRTEVGARAWLDATMRIRGAKPKPEESTAPRGGGAASVLLWSATGSSSVRR